MDATSLGLPKPELTDGGTTTTERQAYKDAWDAQIETADANILSAIGTGGAQVDTAANFTASNPTLNEDQFGYESDTGKFKLGDGATAWNALAYYFDGSNGNLPDQTGHDGEFLTTNGATADWGVPAGSGDVLGAGTPVVGDIAQYTNVDGKHVSPATRTYYNAVDHGGAVRHASNDIGTTFRDWIDDLSNCVVVFPPCAAGTYYNLTSDLTIPDGVTIIQHGLFKMSSTVAVSGTFTCTWTAGPTITVVSGRSTVQVTAGSAPSAGQIIKTAANHVYHVRRGDNGYGYFEIWEAAAASETGASTTKSTTTVIAATGDTTGLQVGDILHVGSQTLPISNVYDATTLWVYEYPEDAFAGQTITRDARLIIGTGDIETSPNVQIFSGGSVRFKNSRTVYPEWWGATSNGDDGDSAVNSAAIMRAIYSGTSITSGGATMPPTNFVEFSNGIYQISKPIFIHGGQTIAGRDGSSIFSGGKSIIRTDESFNGPAAIIDAPGSIGYSSGFVLNNTHWKIHGLGVYTAGSIFGNCFVDGMKFSSITIGEAYNCYIQSSGWPLDSSEASVATHNIWINGSTHGIGIRWDNYCYNNDISHGVDITGYADITSTNWTLSEGAYTHTTGNTSPLIFSFAGATKRKYLRPQEVYVVRISDTDHTGGTGGDFTAKFNNVSIAGSDVFDTGTIKYYQICPLLDDSDMTLTITPETDYVGALTIRILAGTGIVVKGAGNRLLNNMIYGDGGAAVSLLFDGGDGHATNCRLGPAGAGVCFGGISGGFGKLDGCDIGSNFCVGAAFVNTVANKASIEGSRFHGNITDNGGVASIGGQIGSTVGSNYIALEWLNCNGAIVRNNDVEDAQFLASDFTGTAGLFENNRGYDLGVTFPDLVGSHSILSVNSATPLVNSGANFKTANTNPTTITNLVGNYAGKVVKILVADANTTFDFTGTNLKGNGGADFVAQSGDLLTFTGDGTNWHGIISSIH